MPHNQGNQCYLIGEELLPQSFRAVSLGCCDAAQHVTAIVAEVEARPSPGEEVAGGKATCRSVLIPFLDFLSLQGP